ncbi:MAG: bifunctional phosphoglucose/phosphomannose isomerase [Candidatus Heimdallarchaeota archaeon]|nr:bifunctional phosphoglucose/phosphomannose isomerase [Candidatus Heimdallarchaeota archaeon]
MIDLDEQNRIIEIDKSNQLQILEKWSSLFKEARENSLKTVIPEKICWKDKSIKYGEPSNIVVCGMGGSAIAGDYLSCLLKNELKIPILVNRDYYLPAFSNSSTLIICVSYSGNTEETLSCFKDALTKGTMIITISSGGLLEKLSKKSNVPHIKIREGIPPRTGLPLIYTSLLTILEKFKLIEDMSNDFEETEKILAELSIEYSPEKKTERNFAKKIAYGLYNKLPLFVGHTIYSPVSYRAKSELNENSKVMAINEEVPEQNHNGIVAWDNPNIVLNNVAVILIRDKKEPNPIKVRMEQLKKIIEQKTEKVLELYPKGESKLAKQISLTYLIDITSIYLAVLYEVDPSITPSIDNLKGVLKKKLNLQDKIEKEFE